MQCTRTMLYPSRESSILLASRMIAAALFFAGSLAGAAEVYFSPDGGAQDQIIKRINLSKSTIDVAVYSFTAPEIAEALANAEKRGVKVRVIRDYSQSSNKNDENGFLEQAGIPVEIRSGRGRGIMHDKFAIFDGTRVFTGSYNWTENAEHNNWENAIFLDDSALAATYESEFQKIWNSAAKLSSKHRSSSRRTTNPAY